MITRNAFAIMATCAIALILGQTALRTALIVTDPFDQIGGM